MMQWASTLSYLAYSIGAILCTIAVIWIARKGDKARNDRTAGVVALVLTANWCFASASFDPDTPIVELTEIARNLAWVYMLFRLFSNDGRAETLRLVRPAILALVFVELLQFALVIIPTQYSYTPKVATLVFESSVLFRMMVAIGALVLLHNLYVGAASSSRRKLRWNAAALAGFWAFDLNYFTLAYLIGAAPTELVPIRGLAAGIVAIPFALGFNPNSAGIEFRPSRTVTFRSLSLIVIGGYLALMLGLARSLDMLNGDLARLTQVGLVIAAGALALVWLPSERLRGWLRVTAVKHLFKHRYDYRNEWIRFTGTLGNTGYDQTSLQERAIKALADITDSPSGLLLTPDEDGALCVAANWRWPTTDIPAPAASAALATILERENLILDLTEVRQGVDHYGENVMVPEWLRDDPHTWAAVPLLHFDRLVGLIVLSRPAVERKLDWEDFDLLTVVGRQLASYLAEEAGQAALMEAGRFEEFNRRMAFVMHDIKNLSSQMTLLLSNAEKHADNPEFRKDMLVTLRNSSEKLNALLARLGQYRSYGPSSDELFDLSMMAKVIVDRFRPIHPVSLVRSESAIVTGDVEALEQALAHLVQNAIEAGEGNPAVTIEVFSDGVSGKLQVVDNGKGMTPQFVRNGLFKPFVSLKEGGFGIGAFEAREVIRAMGGRLDVESREGLGTRFTVSVPLQATSQLNTRQIEADETEPA